MPAANFVLLLLIGTILGGAAAVVFRGRRSLFMVNVLLGLVGSLLGAFFPWLLGRSTPMDVGSGDYLMRAVFGAFVLILLASLFRSSRPAQL